MFRWNGWFSFLLRHSSLYISKLELVTCLFRSCLCSELLCNYFSAWRIWIPAKQCKKSRIFENCKYCKYIVISVCSEERIPLFNYCLFLTEYARFIYLYFFYKFEKKTWSLPVTDIALLNCDTGVVCFSFFLICRWLYK